LKLPLPPKKTLEKVLDVLNHIVQKI
jgi:hypothetical protein